MLRSAWSKAISEGLALLKRCRHPFARVVYQLVTGRASHRGEKVELFPLAEITRSDFCEYIESYNECNKRKISYAYPPTEEALSVMRTDMDGIIYGSRIYVNENLKNPEQICLLLIHELTHFVRRGIEPYDSPESIFNEELAAHFAEELIWSDKRITRSKLREIALKISELYETPMPDKISIPDYAPLDKAVTALGLKRA